MESWACWGSWASDRMSADAAYFVESEEVVKKDRIDAFESV